MYQLAIILYALVVRLIAPFYPKAKKMIQGQKQTFAILKKKRNPESQYIWFHAASLGEFEQGRPLIEKIKQEHPEYKILLSFFSPSGYEVRKDYQGADIVCYLPFDFFWNAKQFLKIVQPSMAVFIKYEFWMNYLHQLKKKKIPTYLVSGIFRPNQLFFRPYGIGYRSVFKYFSWFFVQDQASMDLLNRFNVNNVSISGDTRFDRVHEIYQQRKQLPLIEQFLHLSVRKKDFAVVAGSTWPKDEDILIPYFNRHPAMKLIIVPHEIHEEHIQSIVSRLERPCIRYSKATAATIAEVDCLVIDCFGLLSSAYRYGEVAYIGGGFGSGIHNVLEAAVYGIPVIFGPNFQKFKEAKDLLDVSGAYSINGEEAFEKQMNELLSNSELTSNAGKQAGDFVARHIGATNIIYRKIFEI